MIHIDEVLKKVTDFPTLPAIYEKLNKKLSDPKASVHDISNIVTKDPAATAKILKVVNSPVYGIKEDVKTVSQAIFFLGFREVKNIILSLGVMDMFSTTSKDGFSVLSIWKHSLAVACISRLLADKLGIKDKENYFVAGITHDIGILFFMKFFQKIYQTVIGKAFENNIPLAVIEEKIFGSNHYTVGEEIAKRWKLPTQLSRTIGNQSSGLVKGEFDQLVGIVHVANIMTKMMSMDYRSNPAIPEPNVQVLNKLEFPEGFFSGLYPLIYDSYRDAVSILKI